jgi:O-antigen ligase
VRSAAARTRASIAVVAASPAPATPPHDTRSGPEARLTAAPSLIGAAGLLAAVTAGATLARDLRLGLALVALCAFVPLVALSLPLALAAWIPVAWNEFSHVAGRAPGAGLLLLLVAWIGTRRFRDSSVTLAPSVRVARVALTLLLVWVTLSISWAADRADAWTEVLQWYLAGGSFLLVMTVATTPARVRLIVAAFLVGALASIVVGLTGSGLSTTANAIDLATRQRFSGGAGDPNYLAAGLVAAIALAAGLLPAARDALAKLGLVAAILALVVALAATESRGGLVAAAVAVAAALVLARERRAQTAALGVLAVAGMTIFLLLSPASWHRMTTFDAGGSGRSDLWRVATRMASDHPLVGVGARGFAHESKNYVLRPGSLTAVDKIVDRPAVTHNVYLQQLADTGAVGLLALLAACGACLVAAQQAARRFRADGDRAMAALAVATTVATIGMLTASTFISNATDKRLWIVLALGPALLAAAQRASTER